jgi:hypothetical protein
VPRGFQPPDFGITKVVNGGVFMPTTRVGISGSARQNWNDSNWISKEGGLVFGSVGVAIPGASYGPEDVGFPHQLPLKRKLSSRLATVTADERASEHRVGTREQVRSVNYPHHP